MTSDTLKTAGELETLTPYEVLGLDTTAELKAIKKAYRQLALKYHPDKNQSLPEGCEESIKFINAAYHTLSDADLKQAYDDSSQPAAAPTPSCTPYNWAKAYKAYEEKKRQAIIELLSKHNIDHALIAPELAPEALNQTLSEMRRLIYHLKQLGQLTLENLQLAYQSAMAHETHQYCFEEYASILAHCTSDFMTQERLKVVFDSPSALSLILSLFHATNDGGRRSCTRHRALFEAFFSEPLKYYQAVDAYINAHPYDQLTPGMIKKALAWQAEQAAQLEAESAVQTILEKFDLRLNKPLDKSSSQLFFQLESAKLLTQKNLECIQKLAPDQCVKCSAILRKIPEARVTQAHFNAILEHLHDLDYLVKLCEHAGALTDQALLESMFEHPKRFTKAFRDHQSFGWKSPLEVSKEARFKKNFLAFTKSVMAELAPAPVAPPKRVAPLANNPPLAANLPDFDALLTKLEELKKKAGNLRKNGHLNAAKTATQLREKISSAIDAFRQHPETGLQQFKEDCHQSIKAASPELERHRGFVHYLKNLFIAILSLGTAMLVNKYMTGKYLFFPATESMKVVQSIEERVKHLEVAAAC